MCETMLHATGASFEFAFVTSVTGFAAHYTGRFDLFDFDLAKRAAKDMLNSKTVTPLVAIRTKAAWVIRVQRDADEAKPDTSFSALRGTMTREAWAASITAGHHGYDHGEAGLLDGHFQRARVCRMAGYRPEYAHVAQTTLFSGRARMGKGQERRQCCQRVARYCKKLGMHGLTHDTA